MCICISRFSLRSSTYMQGAQWSRDLVAQEQDDEVVLVCLDCDFVQDWIPEVVFSIENMKEALGGMMEGLDVTTGAQ